MKVTIRKQFIFILFLLLTPVWAIAQDITVKGTVKDTQGQSLIGVSIIESGSSTNGTATDLDGNFVIKVAKTAKLNFSYIGFNKTTVSVDGRQIINVVLEEESKYLNEVVVVGYGQMKRSDLTGSVSSVNSDAINESVPTSIDQVL